MPGFPRCVAVLRGLENPNIRIHPERALATNRTGLVELPSVGSWARKAFDMKNPANGGVFFLRRLVGF